MKLKENSRYTSVIKTSQMTPIGRQKSHAMAKNLSSTSGSKDRPQGPRKIQNRNPKTGGNQEFSSYDFFEELKINESTSRNRKYQEHFTSYNN